MSAAVPAATRASRLRAVPRWLQHALFLAAVLLVWQLVTLVVEPLTLPAIPDVLAALYEVTASGELGEALGQSVTLLVLGLAIASVIGFLFGVLIGRSRLAQWTLTPYFSALFVTPTVALVPLVLVWFGFGLTGRVIVVVLAALVPILLSVASGLRDDPGELVEVARSFGVRGEVGLLRHVRLRAAVPVIVSGLKLAVGRAIVGMAVAETYLRLGGIGGLIRGYGARFQTDFVVATILPLSLLGIVLTFAVGLLERRFEGWKT